MALAPCGRVDRTSAPTATRPCADTCAARREPSTEEAMRTHRPNRNSTTRVAEADEEQAQAAGGESCCADSCTVHSPTCCVCSSDLSQVVRLASVRNPFLHGPQRREVGRHDDGDECGRALEAMLQPTLHVHRREQPRWQQLQRSVEVSQRWQRQAVEQTCGAHLCCASRLLRVGRVERRQDRPRRAPACLRLFGEVK